MTAADIIDREQRKLGLGLNSKDAAEVLARHAVEIERGYIEVDGWKVGSDLAKDHTGALRLTGLSATYFVTSLKITGRQLRWDIPQAPAVRVRLEINADGPEGAIVFGWLRV